jgi:hypothetical protein
MKDKKVYCKYCRWLEDTRNDEGDLICQCKEIEKYSAYDKYKVMIWDVWEQNKNNDCEYYEYKKYKPPIF